MRTKEEITDLITEIDNRIGTVKNKEDLEYLGDVKATLQWVLKKILTEKETSKIEENLKEISNKTDIDELSDDEFKASMDFMNKEFEGRFKGRDPYTVCNVDDALSWVLEDISTKQFLSDSFLKLK
ncbi:MAG: hypothetical protein Q8M95_04975 [Candidatus Methanoperedens sp.]|nr:hypothetical protein [Candidatus Methanoperedens sp.]